MNKLLSPSIVHYKSDFVWTDRLNPLNAPRQRPDITRNKIWNQLINHNVFRKTAQMKQLYRRQTTAVTLPPQQKIKQWGMYGDHLGRIYLTRYLATILYLTAISWLANNNSYLSMLQTCHNSTINWHFFLKSLSKTLIYSASKLPSRSTTLVIGHHHRHHPSKHAITCLNCLNIIIFIIIIVIIPVNMP